MTYDGENRLKSAEYTDSGSVIHRTEYYYSGDNLLTEVKKYINGSPTSDMRFVRDRFLGIQERDGSNNVTREYKLGIDEGGGIGGLLNLNQGGMNYSYLYDGKGNVTALINSSQNIVATYAYDPFGKLMNKTGTLNQPYMFSTKEYDSETGLSYYGYRFYSSSLGRWITRDPIKEIGGMNLYGFISEDPIGFKSGDVNLYAYTANNPVNRKDPKGLAWYRYGNWCGPGGSGTPTNCADSACKRHDECYDKCGIDAFSRWLPSNITNACAAQCDATLASDWKKCACSNGASGSW
jgi:RHS repeat-associated protein